MSTRESVISTSQRKESSSTSYSVFGRMRRLRIGASYPPRLERDELELPGGLKGVLKSSSRSLRVPLSAELRSSILFLVRGGVIARSLRRGGGRIIFAIKQKMSPTSRIRTYKKYSSSSNIIIITGTDVHVIIPNWNNA